MSTNATPEVTTDQLLADLKTVMTDAEALLRATSAQTGEKIQEVRARAEESLRQAKARLGSIEEEALRRAREVADATDDYVRENPWQSVGIAAGVGLLVGLLLARRKRAWQRSRRNKSSPSPGCFNRSATSPAR
jgi:ElaB/YqjD/DUF883 family membrane-anchored ribosome-binding protein